MSVNNLLQNSNQPFLIMVHRGFWGGNIIENTRQSAMLAKRAGADLIEVDVCRSKDGQYYLFHDGGEADLLGQDLHFHQWLAADLEAVSLRNSLGQPSGFHLEKLADFLAWLPADYYVNLDRSWVYWEDVTFFELLSASGKLDQLFLKSPVKKELLDVLSVSPFPFNYMPIIYCPEEMTFVESYAKIKTIGAEIIVDQLPEHPLVEETFIQDLKDKNYLIVANAEHLGERFRLFDQLNDTTALFEDEQAWGKMVALGVNVIQTDWPNFLKEYRRAYHV